jgi:hypothetical protein
MAGGGYMSFFLNISFFLPHVEGMKERHIAGTAAREIRF